MVHSNLVRAGALALALSLAPSAAFAMGNGQLPAPVEKVDPIVREKLLAEKTCLLRRTGPQRADCLEGLADWWWSESVKYELGDHDPIREIYRILGIAIRHDVKDLDLFTNYLWFQFSIDINNIQDGLATDITMAAIEKVNEYERHHVGNFFYPFVVVDQIFLFVNPKGLGSKAMKLKYLAFGEGLQKKARALYPSVAGRMTADERAQTEFQLDTMDRVLAKRRAQVEALE